MEESTSNIVELAFLVCLLVIVATLSVKDVFYVKDNLSEHTEITDKTSGTEYSTLIDKALLTAEDLEQQVLAIVLASDTDKLANVNVDIYLNGSLSRTYEMVGNQLTTIVETLYEEIEVATGIADHSRYEFEIAIGLSETTISVYVKS